jgi:Uma2 family endonuclease
MNELHRQPRSRPTTQAAEGVPRLKWTLAEFERLTELGILTEDDRIELIGGELVPMSPKGNRHEVVRGAIHNWLRRNMPDEIDYHVEPGWRVDGNYCEPDFLIGPRGFSPTSINPRDVICLIEVAHHSLKLDTTTKAGMYAALGVRDYGVSQAIGQRIWQRHGCEAGQGPGAAAVAVIVVEAFRSRHRMMRVRGHRLE